MSRSIGTRIFGDVRLKADATATEATINALRWPLCFVLALAAAGCSKPEAPAKTAPTYTLREVTLPALSRGSDVSNGDVMPAPDRLYEDLTAKDAEEIAEERKGGFFSANSA